MFFTGPIIKPIFILNLCKHNSYLAHASCVLRDSNSDSFYYDGYASIDVGPDGHIKLSNPSEPISNVLFSWSWNVVPTVNDSINDMFTVKLQYFTKSVLSIEGVGHLEIMSNMTPNYSIF